MHRAVSSATTLAIGVQNPAGNPTRSVAAARQWRANDAGDRPCQAVIRLHSWRNEPVVRILYTWIMTEDWSTNPFRYWGDP